jgi:hypothetical protein
MEDNANSFSNEPSQVTKSVDESSKLLPLPPIYRIEKTLNELI